jgi:hypothetical protein
MLHRIGSCRAGRLRPPPPLRGTVSRRCSHAGDVAVAGSGVVAPGVAGVLVRREAERALHGWLARRKLFRDWNKFVNLRPLVGVHDHGRERRWYPVWTRRKRSSSPWSPLSLSRSLSLSLCYGNVRLRVSIVNFMICCIENSFDCCAICSACELLVRCIPTRRISNTLYLSLASINQNPSPIVSVTQSLK